MENIGISDLSLWNSIAERRSVLLTRAALLFIFCVVFAVGAQAQTFRGAINGAVTDPAGAAVAGAQVKILEIATGVEHSGVSTSDGEFSFQDLPLGYYKVTVTATGFPPFAVDRVEVIGGQIYTLGVKLKLETQATTVEITADSLSMNTTTATQTNTIPSDVLQDVPLNGRDFTQLIAIQPGYGGYAVGGYGSLNGTRPNQMNWQIDGVDNNDFWHNIPAVNQGGVSGIAGVVLPIDSIDEFSSQTQSGSEAGRNAGGTVNLSLKSGGNALHGTVYYYNRNEAFASPSPFYIPSAEVPKAPPLRNENYGFSAGGPIRKNKTFFFVSYEKQQYLIGLSGLATEPSDAWITLAEDLLNNPGGKYGAYAPVAASSLSQTLIGPDGLWPRGLIGSLPATLNNFFSPVASTGYSYNGVLKLDHNFNEKNHFSIRGFLGQGSQTQPTGGSPALGTASSNLPYYFEVAPIHVYNYSAVLNTVINPSMTNQILAGVNYFNQVFHDANNSFDTAALGLFLSPDATINGKPIPGAPNVQIAGFEQIGITPPEGRNDVTWQLTDILSYTHGTQQFRFGGEFRQGRVNEFYHRHGTGSFSFTGAEGPWGAACGLTTPTAACSDLANSGLLANAESLADYLAGEVASSSIAVGNPERYVKVNAFSLFGSDTWQATRRLSFNFGMRYEYFGPMHSTSADTANFIPGTGLEIAGGGNLNSLYQRDTNNFAPRVGFSYQPTQKGDLVLRGGFGVFYDQINMNPFLDFRGPGGTAQGIQGNPIGPAAVSTYSSPLCPTNADGSYNWQAVQGSVCPDGVTPNPKGSVFPGVVTCIDPLCSNVSGLNLFSVNQNFVAPYFYNYSLQVEKGLGNAAILQVGYVGSEGRKLNIVSNINQNDAFPNFGTILQLNSAGTSNYNALQATFRLRTWHGVTVQSQYTYGHSLDEVSEYRAVILDDAFNRKFDYGNSDYDTRHLFTTSVTYVVPQMAWADGWKGYIVNGWQLSSLLNFHSGQPYDETRSGLDLIGDPFKGLSHTFSAAQGGTVWINPSSFAVPLPGDPGAARNTVRGPGFSDVDFSIFKNIPITERVHVQLRAEFYNLFNRVNLASGPGAVNLSCGAANPTSPLLADRTCTSANGFGLVSDTIGDFNGAPGIGPGEARNIQLVAKIIF